jgi:hypothetical protein
MNSEERSHGSCHAATSRSARKSRGHGLVLTQATKSPRHAPERTSRTFGFEGKPSHRDPYRPVGRRTWMCAVFRFAMEGESENPRVNETTGLPCRGEPFLLVTFLWAQQRKVTRAKRESLAPKQKQAKSLGPRLRGDDERGDTCPFAGMTGNSTLVVPTKAENTHAPVSL